MEHDLLLSVDGVDGLRTRLTVGHIQTPPKPAPREEGQSVSVLPSSLLDFCPLKAHFVSTVERKIHFEESGDSQLKYLGVNVTETFAGGRSLQSGSEI